MAVLETPHTRGSENLLYMRQPHEAIRGCVMLEPHAAPSSFLLDYYRDKTV
jgi:hypothetical protein